jgi:hypothetical protein
VIGAGRVACFSLVGATNRPLIVLIPRFCVTIKGVWPRDLTIDDLVAWGWSTALASTGIVFMYWVDVIVGAVLLVVGLAGMRTVRLRHRRRSTVPGQK